MGDAVGGHGGHWSKGMCSDPRGFSLFLKSPFLHLLFDKTPGTSRKPGLEESRGLVSVLVLGMRAESRGVLLALVTSGPKSAKC